MFFSPLKNKGNLAIVHLASIGGIHSMKFGRAIGGA